MKIIKVFLILCLVFTVSDLKCDEPQKLALIIGITGYPNYPVRKRLKFADNDADLFGNFIMTKEGHGFNEKNIKILKNKDASREEIFKSIIWLSKKIKSRDTIVYIFFSGHGCRDQSGETYLMPYEADINLPEANGIRTDHFVEQLRKKINVKCLISLVDACHSGSLVEDGIAKGEEDNIIDAFKKAWEKEFNQNETGSMAFLSASSNQLSFEDDKLGKGHGLFTWFLVKGMEGLADGILGNGKDKKVTAEELFKFVADKVAEYSRNRFNESQNPCRSPQFYADYPFSILDIANNSIKIEKYKLVLNKKNFPPKNYIIGNINTFENEKGYFETYYSGHTFIYIPKKGVNQGGFYVDKYEVSFFQLESLNGFRKYRKKRNLKNFDDNHPAIVSFKEALKYCVLKNIELNNRNIKFRLLNSNEWEYVAGIKRGFKYSWGNEDVDDEGEYRANYDDNIENCRDGYLGLAPVKSFEKYASPFGIINLSGNAWEWVEEKLCKGGSYLSMNTKDLMITSSSKAENFTGFRCIVVINEIK